MNETRFLNKRFIISVTSFGGLLIILGIILYYNLDSSINKMVLEKIQREAHAAAMYYEEELNSEYYSLSHVGNLLVNQNDEDQESNVDAAIQLINNVFGNDPRIIIGLMNGNYTAVYGEALSTMEYRGILSAMQGRTSVYYTNTGGLLFAYPVYHGDNIRYVIYSLCSSSYIAENHGLSMFDNIGHVMIMTKSGEEIVPFDFIAENEKDFYDSYEVKKVFLKLITQDINKSSAITLQHTTLGDMYFYVNDIANTDFVLVGTRTKEDAYGNFIVISPIIMAVYFLFVAIVLILMTYLYIASVKVRESDELRLAKEKAESASRAKGEFLANMTHEIRTPINAVLGINEMILREFQDKQIRQYAYIIKNSMMTLLNLVNDVLDYSRMEAGKIHLINESYDSAVMISDLFNIVGNRAEEKKLSFDIAVDKTLPKELVGDVIRIKQVIINLLTNAFKYTERGFVNLIISYEQVDDKSINMKVVVKDSGIGMKEEDIGRLFKAFERIEEDRNKTIEGTGLGMNIVKNLLDLMGSHIEVESVYGVGSKFSFVVKQEVANWEPIGDYHEAYEKAVEKETEKDKTYAALFEAPDAKLLVVDDTEMNLFVVKGLLKNTLIKMDTAKSGAEALELINDNKYDAMLIDQRMPEMDGMELIKRIRHNLDNPNNNKPCICLTANAVAGVKEQCLLAGFDDYLEKPVDGKTLEDTLIKYLPKELVKVKEQDEADADNREAPEESCEAKEPSVEAAGDNQILKDLEAKGLIDIEAGISYAGSDDMFIATVQFFRDAIDEKADEIETLYFKEDVETYGAKVHALKSSARIIGAKDLSEKALALEKAANEKDWDFVKANNTELLSDYRRYKDYLKGI